MSCAIGYVTRNPATDTFKGLIRTLSIRAEIEIIPNRSKSTPQQPDYRVVSGAVELGAGWIKTGERSGKDYVSLGLAAPEFGPRRIFVNLGKAQEQDDEDTFALIWNPVD